MVIALTDIILIVTAFVSLLVWHENSLALWKKLKFTERLQRKE